MSQPSAWTRLLLAVQADTDPQHRQRALEEIAIIGAIAGNGTPAADLAGVAALARLYPQESP